METERLFQAEVVPSSGVGLSEQHCGAGNAVPFFESVGASEERMPRRGDFVTAPLRDEVNSGWVLYCPLASIFSPYK
jgi:hypothetical protein